ncbi:flagellin [Azospirillum sp.]|uniref:flagellin N-terminal helical domain-containing protein n=1 Tax=Azospirillum sp. TaxID=34012 RepID=UPI002D3F8624|nr:flagellin [Azospirillum sp.]HYD69890.1 flagellin [Azospirillum sp.]
MSVSDVGLTATMRSNLLLLQSTQSRMDRTQQALSTGNKINSALDGPTAFFAAKGLNQRAGDLTALKDAMGQAINTIKAGDKGISAIESLVEQARGLTTAAFGALGNDAASMQTRKTLAQQFNTIKAQIDKIAGDSGYAGKNMLSGNGLRLDSTSESRGQANSIVGVDNARTSNVVSQDTYTVKVEGSAAISGNTADISKAEQDRGLTSLSVGGELNGTLGSFSDVTIETRGVAGRERTFTISDGTESRTVKYFDNSQKAETAVTIPSTSSTGKTANVSFSGTIEKGDTFTVAVAGQSFVYEAQEGDDAGTIAQNLSTQMGTNVSGVSVSADATAGTLTIAGTQERGDFTVSSTAENAQFKQISETFASGATVSFTVDRKLMETAVNGGNGMSSIEKNVDIKITATNLAGTTVTRDGNSQRGLGKLANGENSFAFDSGTVRMTIDEKTIKAAAQGQQQASITSVQVSDANTSNDLTVQFNENNSNSITVVSQNVTTDGQGLRLDAAQNDWVDRSDIDKAVAGIEHAKGALRAASQSLSTNLNIVTTRETFTKEFSDVLVEGSNKLTLADQNEEGANQLMLQTRQQLGTIALSMANQSQQAILRLF